MSKSTENYEEQVLKEFEETQGIEDAPKQETFTDLGKVQLDGGYSPNSDPDIQRILNSMDYLNIPLEDLPSQGRFYPENTRISIRAAKVGEIREYSTIDETDPRDIRDKMTYMVSQCIKVYFGNVPGQFRDLLEDDRIVLVLKIKELTFLDGSSNIKIPVPEGACKTAGCHPQETVDFSTSKLEFNTPSPSIEKYYDPTSRCYNVQTKSFGVISLYPPTIGVTTAVADWVKEQQRDNKTIDGALAEMIPYLIKDWRGLTSKQVFAKITELAGWSASKFALVTRLKDEINVGIKYEITETCSQCGGELKIPVIFPDGFKSLFVPTISDFGGELL